MEKFSKIVPARGNALLRARFVWPLFLFGAIINIKLSLGGEFFVGELFALVFMLIGIVRFDITRTQMMFFVGAIFLATIQMASDQINQTPFMTSVKGVGAPIFLAISIYFVSAQVRRGINWLPSVLLGMGFTALVYLLLLPNPYLEGNPWKWGYGALFLGVLVILYSFFPRLTLKRAFPALLAVFCAYSVMRSSRSLMLIPLLGYLSYLFWSSRFAAGASRFLGGRFGFAKYVLAIVFVLAASNQISNTIFSSKIVLNSLAEDDQRKYTQQVEGVGGMLLGGRSESLIALQAFADSPWYGHGSLAEDKTGEYAEEFAWRRYQLGLQDTAIAQENLGNLIPCHSYLLGAMVWAGVIGGLFWIAVLVWVFRIYREYAMVIPLYFHVGIVGLVWNILFSPFGADARWATAVFIGALHGWTMLVRGGKA